MAAPAQVQGEAEAEAQAMSSSASDAIPKSSAGAPAAESSAQMLEEYAKLVALPKYWFAEGSPLGKLYQSAAGGITPIIYSK